MTIAADRNTPLEQELVITRVFNAPRELVFEAWTDPRRAKSWWGPVNYPATHVEMDVRPGGAIRIVMRGPDGVEYPMKGVFRALVPPERLVFVSSALEDKDGNPQLQVLNTVTFAKHNGRTKVTLQAVVVKATPQAAGALAGMEAGWTQSLERLADLLSKILAMTSAGKKIRRPASSESPTPRR